MLIIVAPGVRLEAGQLGVQEAEGGLVNAGQGAGRQLRGRARLRLVQRHRAAAHAALQHERRDTRLSFKPTALRSMMCMWQQRCGLRMCVLTGVPSGWALLMWCSQQQAAQRG